MALPDLYRYGVVTEKMARRETRGVLSIGSPDYFFQSVTALVTHQKISAGLENPYFKFTGVGEKVFQETVRNGMNIKVGPIGSFSEQEVAIFVQTLAKSYTTRLGKREEQTMGDFPNSDPVSQEKLLRIFVEGFSKDHALAMLTMGKGMNKRILGGVMIAPGKQDVPLLDLIGRKDSKLSTFQALNFRLSQKWIRMFLGTYERNAFVVSRLFKNLNYKEKNASFVLDELLIGINTAREGLERKLNRNLSLGVADISSEALFRVVREYGWEKISESVTPTRAIMNTILKYHYGYFTEFDKGRNIFALAARSQDLAMFAKLNLSKISEVQVFAPQAS